jgi:hypothetical protein
MHNVRMRLFEDVEEVPRSIRQMPAHVRLHGEALLSHLLTEWAKSCDRIDARAVPLFPLQTAHLRHEGLGAAHLHAVYYVSNLQEGFLSLRKRGTCLFTVPRIHRGKLFDRLNQCIRFVIRSMMYISRISEIANPPAYGSTRASLKRGAIIPRCRAIS